MSLFSLSVAALSLPVFLGATLFAAADATPAAQYEGKDTLLRPEGYREWVFVGSSLGLRYDEGKKEPQQLEFKNVYLDPAAYRAYKQTGAFPEGTILVLETAVGEEKKEKGLRGSFQKAFTGLSAAVKDKKRFPDGWAYFSFSDGPGKTKPRAQPARKTACYDCHREKGAQDNVFTQFYPVLKAAQARADEPSWEGQAALLTRPGVQLRAGCPDAKIRDGAKALEVARKAHALAKGPVELAALAAAHAELGRFDRTVEWQEMAVATAPEGAKEQYRERLVGYQDRKPFRLNNGSHPGGAPGAGPPPDRVACRPLAKRQ